MGTMTVLSGGLQTTLQDLGRPGHARLGVSAAGAADALALRIANRLAGNLDGAAGLEMTILGGSFRFDSAAHLAVAGADMRGAIGEREAPAFATFSVAAGQTLRFGPAESGARTYLAVRGGFEASLVLGSASTHLPSRMGGLEGRPLRQGDRLGYVETPAPPERRLAPLDRSPVARKQVLRVTDGAQAERFSAAGREILYRSMYTVSGDSNRMGLRLLGPAVPAPLLGRMPTEGMPLGAVQVPPGGQPVILFVDHQTTGGYPVIASVISADLFQVGQLRPRDLVGFERVPIDTARRLLVEQETWLQAALPAVS